MREQDQGNEISEETLKRIAAYDPNADGSLTPYQRRSLTSEQLNRPLSGPNSVDGVWKIKSLRLSETVFEGSTGSEPDPTDDKNRVVGSINPDALRKAVSEIATDQPSGLEEAFTRIENNPPNPQDAFPQ